MDWLKLGGSTTVCTRQTTSHDETSGPMPCKYLTKHKAWALLTAVPLWARCTSDGMGNFSANATNSRLVTRRCIVRTEYNYLVDSTVICICTVERFWPVATRDSIDRSSSIKDRVFTPTQSKCRRMGQALELDLRNDIVGRFGTHRLPARKGKSQRHG